MELTGCSLRGNGTDYRNYGGNGKITADGERKYG